MVASRSQALQPDTKTPGIDDLIAMDVPAARSDPAGEGGLTSDTVIRLEGGLPPLPGTDIIMPEINQGTNGHVIEHEARPVIEAAPSDDQETNPRPQAEDPPI
jgi:hypothetical protein